MNKLYENIYSRKSTRQFSLEKIENEIIREIKGLLIQTKTLFNTNLHTYLVSRTDVYSMLKGFFGSFGIIEAPYYIILANENTNKGYIDAGFVGEHIILELTQKSIATCWIGANFNESQIKKFFNIKTNVLALIALGKASDYSPHRDSSAVKRNSLKSIVFNKELPGQPFLQVLESIRHAPSAVNSQPWRILITDDRISLYLDKSSIVRKMVLSELNYIDMGIAAKHLEVSLNNFDIQFLWENKCPKEIKDHSHIISANLKHSAQATLD